MNYNSNLRNDSPILGREPTEDNPQCTIFENWKDEDIERFTLREEGGNVQEIDTDTEQSEGSPISILILDSYYTDSELSMQLVDILPDIGRRSQSDMENIQYYFDLIIARGRSARDNHVTSTSKGHSIITHSAPIDHPAIYTSHEVRSYHAYEEILRKVPPSVPYTDYEENMTNANFVRFVVNEAQMRYPGRRVDYILHLGAITDDVPFYRLKVYSREAEKFRQWRTIYHRPDYKFHDWKLSNSMDLLGSPYPSLGSWDGIHHAQWLIQRRARLFSSNLQRPIRLLSLDGGGIRGLSSLYILKRIMEKLYEDGIIAAKTRPFDYFDMIGGTSTGGLIAILLGRHRMSVEECIIEYERLGKEIFGKDKSFQRATAFSATHFELIICEIIQRRIGKDDSFLLYHIKYLQEEVTHTTITPIFVVAIDKDRASSPGGVQLFRSYCHDRTTSGDDPEDNYRNVMIWQAARATSAAPTYFKAQKIGERYFVDGGLGHNCPALHLIEEAENYYKESEIGCLISIGTGVEQGVKLAAEGTYANSWSKVPFIGGVTAKIDAALVTKAITTSSEHIHHFVKARFKDRGCPNAYHRFSVASGMEVKLQEYQKIPLIQKATDEYLQHPATKKAIDACVAKLASLDLPENCVSTHQRRSFSKPNEVQSAVQSSSHMTKELLLKLHQLPHDVPTTIDISPESVWPSEQVFQVIHTADIRTDDRSILPTGKLAFKFRIQPSSRYDGDGDRKWCRLRALAVDDTMQPGFAYRVKMIYKLDSNPNMAEGIQSETTLGKAPISSLWIFVGLRIYCSSTADDVRPTDLVATLNCTHGYSYASSSSWIELESKAVSELLDARGSQFITFELGIPVHQSSEEISLLFGGIRLVTID